MNTDQLPVEGEGGDALAIPEFGLTDAEQESLTGKDPVPAEGEPKGGEPTKKEETPPDDPVYDIPNLGQLTASQIRHMKAQEIQYSRLTADRQEMENARQKLESDTERVGEALQIRDLLDYPGLRQKFSKVVAESMTAEGDTPEDKDGQGTDFINQFRNQELDEVKDQLAQVNQYVASQQEREASQQVDTMFEDFKTRFPDVITDEFRAQVIDDVYDAFKDRKDALQQADLHAFISQAVLDKGIQASKEQGAAELAEALGKQPTGTRVVTGNNSKHSAATPPPKDPAKMSFADLTAEVAASDIFGGPEE